jgi:lysozyme
VDVSEYQGSIDWGLAAASGIAFGIARVSDGTGHPDATFADNYAAIQVAGLVRGSYQFFRPEDDPVAQADLVVAAVGSVGSGDLPPALDVEVTDGESSDTILAGITAWVNEVQAQLGVEPLVYTSPGFFDGLSGAGTIPSTTLWVANWQVSCPDVPQGWSTYSLWQYDDTQTVAGISGAVDTDIFNGTMAELQAFANGGADTNPDGGSSADAGDDGDAGSDGGISPNACSLSSGELGTCMDTSACALMGGSSTPGYCPGPDNIQCCTGLTESSADAGVAASAPSPSSSSSIVSTALANVGVGACSANSQGGTGFETSCTGNGGEPEYWCADFAQWVWDQAGADTTGLDAAAQSFYDYGQNNGTLHSTPTLGDAVAFDNGNGIHHVAIVVQVNGDGSIETVSGDWGGSGSSEADFSSTSSVVLNAPAYASDVQSVPPIMGMTIVGFISPMF